MSAYTSDGDRQPHEWRKRAETAEYLVDRLELIADGLASGRSQEHWHNQLREWKDEVSRMQKRTL